MYIYIWIYGNPPLELYRNLHTSLTEALKGTVTEALEGFLSETLEGTDRILFLTIGALTITRGFWGILYYNYNKEP